MGCLLVNVESIFTILYIKMGNLPTKRGETVSHSVSIEDSTDEMLDQIRDKINPLAVFGLQDQSKQDTIQFLQSNELVKQYRILLRQHHPDKGGSALKCSIINYSYQKLKEAQENLLQHTNDRPRDANELKEAVQSEMISEDTQKELQKSVQKLMKTNPKEFQKKFNEAFELSRMKDYTDDGYDIGERTKHTKRDLIAVKRLDGVTASNLNSAFESKTTVNTALVVKEDCDPEGISSLKHAVYEYGKTKETDFGRLTNGATDYGIAYAGERLVDFETARPKDKDLTGKVSMDTAKKSRALQNMSHQMTETERERWASHQEALQRDEEERLANIVERDYVESKRQSIFMERMLTFSKK